MLCITNFFLGFSVGGEKGSAREGQQGSNPEVRKAVNAPTDTKLDSPFRLWFLNKLASGV